MTDTVTGFYRSVLALPSVDPEIQRQICRYGQLRNDYGLLAALASRPDLLTEIDEEIGKIDAASVRVAWASRPTRTQEELQKLVAGEKRVKVLAALSAREDLPPALYDAIAKHGRGSALEALIVNKALSDETRTLAAQRYAKDFSAKTRVPTPVRALLNSDNAIADIIAASTKNFLLASAALEACGPGVSLDAQRNAVHLSEAFINNNDNDNWTAMMAFECVGDILGKAFDRDDQLLAEFREICLKVSGGKERGYYMTRLKTLAEQLEKMKPSGPPGRDVASMARAINDKDSAQAFINSMEEKMPIQAILAVALNAAFDAKQFLEVLKSNPYSWQGVRDMSWAFPKLSSDKAAALVVIWSYFDNDEQLQRHPNPSDVLLNAAKMVNTDRRIPDTLYRSKYITDDVVDHLPLSIYDNLENGIPLQVTERLAKRVISRLGNDQSQWENLNTLSSGFTGSLNDLLDVAERI